LLKRQQQRISPTAPCHQTPRVCALADGRTARLFWRAFDGVDYLLTLVRLRVLDAICGPEPETPADQLRQRERERLKQAFPNIEP
jgi:hypothetical protein